LTLDATLLQAHLLLELGDSVGAARLADARLGSLANSRPQLLADFVETACLLRLVRLRDSIQVPGSHDRRSAWDAALPFVFATVLEDPK
jgi:hypothetical protein